MGRRSVAQPTPGLSPRRSTEAVCAWLDTIVVGPTTQSWAVDSLGGSRLMCGESRSEGDRACDCAGLGSGGTGTGAFIANSPGSPGRTGPPGLPCVFEARGRCPRRGPGRGPWRCPGRGPWRCPRRGPGRGPWRCPGRGPWRCPQRGPGRGPWRCPGRGPWRCPRRGPGRGEAGPGHGAQALPSLSSRSGR